jgi:hypothetical protein
LSQGERQQVFHQVLYRPGPEHQRAPMVMAPAVAG